MLKEIMFKGGDLMEPEIIRAFANYINLMGIGSFIILTAYGFARIAEAMRITHRTVKG